ncbi:MAG: hypothetical protein U5K81_00140 [Trueperaceae bacterium]|nr:hypothetical protein [Trueperaceae bacterium]
MIRWALALLGVVLAALTFLALQPRAEPPTVREEITLQDAQVRLFPSGDPDATWRFDATRVAYHPTERETTLHDIVDGQRRVGDEVDFTLRAERLVIGPNDDLRTNRMDVRLIEDELNVEMEGREERQVLVDQQAGVFEVPRIYLYGEDFGESRYENMRVSFDFTDFEAGGPGTVGYSELQIEERDAAPGRSDL